MERKFEIIYKKSATIGNRFMGISPMITFEEAEVFFKNVKLYCFDWTKDILAFELEGFTREQADELVGKLISVSNEGDKEWFVAEDEDLNGVLEHISFV